MSEGGVYGQLLTYGAAIGWDSEAGITFSIFHSLSAGVSADVWASWSLSFSDFSVKYDGPTAYFGGGTPTGVPTIITLNVQNNLGSNNYAAQIGIGWNDYAEAGIYGESDFSKQIEYLLLGLKVTFDNYESLAKLFLDQDPQDSIYAHDSFMFATSLYSMGGLFDASVTYDQVEDLVNEAISLNVEGWNAAPHSEDDAISFLVDVFRLADFHEYM